MESETVIETQPKANTQLNPPGEALEYFENDEEDKLQRAKREAINNRSRIKRSNNFWCDHYVVDDTVDSLGCCPIGNCCSEDCCSGGCSEGDDCCAGTGSGGGDGGGDFDGGCYAGTGSGGGDSGGDFDAGCSDGWDCGND